MCIPGVYFRQFHSSDKVGTFIYCFAFSCKQDWILFSFTQADKPLPTYVDVLNFETLAACRNAKKNSADPDQAASEEAV